MGEERRYRYTLPTFFIGLLLTFIAFLIVSHSAQKDKKRHFENLINRAKNIILERVSLYENAMRSGASLYYSSQAVDPDEWKAFVQSFTIVERHPGILGMGVVYPVLKSEEPSFINAVRNNGISNFTPHDVTLEPNILKPDFPAEYLITYIEPLAPNVKALGLNIASEPHRLKAAMQARDTGNPSISRSIQLIQDSQTRAGFLMFFPVYKKGAPVSTLEERQKGLECLIYIPAITQTFFDAFVHEKIPELDFELYDNSHSANRDDLIYSTQPSSLQNSLELVTSIQLSGLDFIIRFVPSHLFIEAESISPVETFLFFISFSILISFVVYTLENTKNKAIGIAQQMTHKLKENEEILRTANTNLESQVAATNMAHENLKNTQEQLLQSQKLESIGKLAGGIAHDFNNLLGGIMGYASLMENEISDKPKAARYLKTIIKSTERGAKLTKDLLGFARKGNYERKVLNLNDCVLETLSLLEGSLEKSISISRNLSPDLLNIEADSTQITQILMNLSLNARDAMEGVGNISITTQNLHLSGKEAASLAVTEGSYVELIFKDSGSGIPDSIRSKIFDPFYTTKAPGKGTGLGLSTVYGIIKNQGGAIELAPYQTGEGACFKLYFRATTKKIVNEPGELDVSFFPHRLEGKKILLADDEIPLRELLKNILEPYEVTVIEAKNGAEAIQIFKDDPTFDVAILDVIMPEVSGIDAFYAIKKLNPLIPVVFITGYTENPELLKIRQQYNTDLIHKPFKKEPILTTLAGLLKA